MFRVSHPFVLAKSAGKKVLVILVSCLLAAASLTACGSQTAVDTMTVRALWFSGEGNSVKEGTAEVVVSFSQHENGKEFTLDLDTEKAQGAGPAWTAASWSAASVATLFSFENPKNLEFSISIDGPIDGPSGGGLMATAMLATIAGFKFKPNATMTGTINPDGSIGMVGGIPAKMRAAKEAGMTRVLIPPGGRRSVDPVTGNLVDVLAEGKSMGIEVIEVKSVLESLAYLTGKDDELEDNPESVPPIAQPVLQSIGQNAAKLDVMVKAKIAEAKKIGVASSDIQIAEKARASGAASLKSGKEVFAYSELWQSYFDLTAQVESRKTQVAIKARGAEAVKQELLQQISDLENLNSSKSVEIAQKKTSNVQQAVGLPDTLTWSTQAAIALRVNKERLAQDGPGVTPLPHSLPMVAAIIGEARAEIDVVMMQSVDVLMDSGAGEVNQEDASNALSAYTGFLQQTGDANINYYEQVLAKLTDDEAKTQHRQRHFGYASAKTLQSELQSAASGPAGNSTNESELVTQRRDLANALSYYVDSAQLVVGVELQGLEQSDDFGRELFMGRESGFENAVDSSTFLNRSLLNILGEEETDSSYAHWNAQWGNWQSTQLEGEATTDDRIEGLQNTWRASIQLLLLSSRVVDTLKPTSEPSN